MKIAANFSVLLSLSVATVLGACQDNKRAEPAQGQKRPGEENKVDEDEDHAAADDDESGGSDDDARSDDEQDQDQDQDQSDDIKPCSANAPADAALVPGSTTYRNGNGFNDFNDFGRFGGGNDFSSFGGFNQFGNNRFDDRFDDEVICFDRFRRRFVRIDFDRVNINRFDFNRFECDFGFGNNGGGFGGNTATATSTSTATATGTAVDADPSTGSGEPCADGASDASENTGGATPGPTFAELEPLITATCGGTCHATYVTKEVWTTRKADFVAALQTRKMPKAPRTLSDEDRQKLIDWANKL